METSSVMPVQTECKGSGVPWAPKSPQATRTLRQIKSAPTRGQQKLDVLKKTYTRLDWRRDDFGVLDIWDDDGTSGNLDQTIRSMRFSAAASNISSLFAQDSSKSDKIASTNPERKPDIQPEEEVQNAPRTSLGHPVNNGAT